MSKDQGKKSVWDWEEKISEYNLPPESRHYKKIRDEECDFLVDYIKPISQSAFLYPEEFEYK